MDAEVLHATTSLHVLVELTEPDPRQSTQIGAERVLQLRD